MAGDGYQFVRGLLILVCYFGGLTPWGGLIFQQVRDPPILIVQFRRANNRCDMDD